MKKEMKKFSFIEKNDSLFNDEISVFEMGEITGGTVCVSYRNCTTTDKIDHCSILLGGGHGVCISYTEA